MIQTGDQLPSLPIKLIDAQGVADTTTEMALGSGRVVLFTVPGAFTPTCDMAHLPGFVANASKLAARGVDRIVCATVNDHHVTRAWAEHADALGKVDFLADVHGHLAQAMGLAKDFPNLGTRFVRSAMIVEGGIVQQIFVQEGAGVTVSGAPAILLALEAAGVVRA